MLANTNTAVICGSRKSVTDSSDKSRIDAKNATIGLVKMAIIIVKAGNGM